MCQQLKIKVNLELIYKDEKNKKLGYVIKEGSNTYKSNTMKFVTSRKKKSSDLGVMLNHQLNPIGHSGVSRNDPYFSSEYKQYLCFSIFCSTNTLVFERSKHLWSEEQQKTHDTIKSLHDSGMGYRKISHYLNEQGIKTPKGNLWGGNNVHSVLKRNRERLQRLETLKFESELEYGKMELVWLREGELWKNPRKDLLLPQ